VIKMKYKIGLLLDISAGVFLLIAVSTYPSTLGFLGFGIYTVSKALFHRSYIKSQKFLDKCKASDNPLIKDLY
jgi:hypothetical protein